jgi:hypothetical protein
MRNEQLAIFRVYRWTTVVICFLLITGSASAQCFNSNTAFGDGEAISYTISYNWGPVWVDAGVVTFSAGLETWRGKAAWHLKSTGRTFPSYDMLFKVRDYYDSWIDPGSFRSFEFRRNIYEGGYTLLNTLAFDPETARVITNTKANNNQRPADTLLMRNCSFDMLSAVYYTRTLDFSGFAVGTTRTVTVLIDDGYYDITLRMIGREVVETTAGKRFRCLKFAAKMVQGTIFQGDEDVVVWVTDDQNKVPVYIEAKILVGTVKAYLKSTKGLRNPVTSLER